MPDFKTWFTNAGGELNQSVGITQFPGMGQGAIAVDNIPEGSTLFTIPRGILLSTHTSTLRERLGENDWLALGSGWEPLIVSMMWEESRGVESPWHGYLTDLPNEFDTLMFWSEEELALLQASTIKDRIGKADAERNYLENVLPVIRRRSDVFDPTLVHSHFSMERFHINGSRVLSRSFQVEDWDPEANSDENDGSDHDSSTNNDNEHGTSTIDNEAVEPGQNIDVEGDIDESDDGDQVKVEHVAMVPMADILNARYGSENAKLYYEKDVLRMISTRDIARGDQIWNTYDDPPNADLLRKYGHVDLIPLKVEVSSATSPIFPYENPADEVEIRADRILDICLQNVSQAVRAAKVDVWLSLGGEDTFAIERDDLLCKPMLGMIRYLSMGDPEVQEAIEKDKLPKGKASGETLSKALAVFRSRLAQYASSAEEDEALLLGFDGQPNRRFNAVFVRLCEKRLLKRAIEKAEAILDEESSISRSKLKRARDEDKESRRAQKKAKR